MKTRKYFLMAAAFVLLAGLYVSALAQARIDRNIWLPPEPIVPIVRVNAIEISDGTFGMDNQTKKETAFGYGFLGRTTGSLPGSFTLSMNCTPAIEIPGETSELTGGSWTLPVYMTSPKGGTAYAGALYGTIAKGSMNWDKAGTSANVYIVLNVDGGTQTWYGVGGFATFAGTILVDEKTHEKTLTGDLVFSMVIGITDR